MGFSHGQIKLSNCFIDDENIVKIGNLEACTEFDGLNEGELKRKDYH